MITLLATDNIYMEISRFNSKEELNRRGFWNINRIPLESASELFRYINDAVREEIGNLVIDIDVYEDKIYFINQLKKIQRLGGFDLYILAVTYNRKDLIIKRLIEEGVNANNIFTGSVDSVCRLLNSNILKDTEKTSPSEEFVHSEEPQQESIPAIDRDPKPETVQKETVIEDKPIYFQSNNKLVQDKPEKTENTDPPLPYTYIEKTNPEQQSLSLNYPISLNPVADTSLTENIFCGLGHSNLNNERFRVLIEEYKQAATNNIRYSAVTIGVTGAGRRVGTTTQALQFVLFLKNSGNTAAYVEMHGKDHLSMYLNVFSEEVQKRSIINENHFTIHDIDIYRSARAMGEAKNNYSYVVCDYGDCSSNELNSFLERDIKVVVGCIKPYEVEPLKTFFSIDCDDINYIYSFVDSSLHQDVIKEMDTAGERTYFAGYTPNLFDYGSNDQIYAEILKRYAHLINAGVAHKVIKSSKILDRNRKVHDRASYE